MIFIDQSATHRDSLYRVEIGGASDGSRVELTKEVLYVEGGEGRAAEGDEPVVATHGQTEQVVPHAADELTLG